MIPILISNKKYKIKSIAELTTAEFIELSKIENCDTVKYIAWQTGVSMQDSFFAVTAKSVELAIGAAPDITKIKKPKGFDYSKIIETVGQRHQIENSGKEGFELLVYCLAVAQARSNNFEVISNLEAEYLQRPFAEILPAGFFFFKIYSNGRKPDRKILNWLRHLIDTAKKKRRRVLKG